MGGFRSRKPDGTVLVDGTKRMMRTVKVLVIPAPSAGLTGTFVSSELTTGTPCNFFAPNPSGTAVGGGFLPGITFSGNTMTWDWGADIGQPSLTVYVCVF